MLGDEYAQDQQYGKRSESVWQATIRNTIRGRSKDNRSSENPSRKKNFENFFHTFQNKQLALNCSILFLWDMSADEVMMMRANPVTGAMEWVVVCAKFPRLSCKFILKTTFAEGLDALDGTQYIEMLNDSDRNEKYRCEIWLIVSDWCLKCCDQQLCAWKECTWYRCRHWVIIYLRMQSRSQHRHCVWSIWANVQSSPEGPKGISLFRAVYFIPGKRISKPSEVDREAFRWDQSWRASLQYWCDCYVYTAALHSLSD